MPHILTLSLRPMPWYFRSDGIARRRRELGVVNVVLAVDVRFLAILPPASADWRPQTNPAGRWPDRGLEYC
jgi:hypothetical protein